MDHLAHALLAGSDAHVVVGSLLGDFWHGPAAPDWPPGIRRGVLLHRHTDTFTDRHPEVAAARGLLPAPYRRYAGILLDVYFDHLLARDWARWGRGELTVFNRQVITALQREQHWLPARMHGLLHSLDRGDRFARYADFATLAAVLRAISARLSRANPLVGSERVLAEHSDAFQATFQRFFPQLLAFAQAERVASAPGLQLPTGPSR